jgi:hypothetical protein
MNSQSMTSTGSNVLRIRTMATRLNSSEMRAVEAAAEVAGITRSEWLRDAALAYLRNPHQRSTTPIDLTILEEIMGLRFLMVNLFAGANPGVALQTVHQLMAHADAVKHEAAKVRVRSDTGLGVSLVDRS